MISLRICPAKMSKKWVCPDNGLNTTYSPAQQRHFRGSFPATRHFCNRPGPSSILLAGPLGGYLVLWQASASWSRYALGVRLILSASRRARHRSTSVRPANQVRLPSSLPPQPCRIPAAGRRLLRAVARSRPAGPSFSVGGFYFWRKIWHSGPAGSEPSMPILVMSSVAWLKPLASAFWAHSEKVNALALLTVTSTDAAVAPPSKKRRRASSRLASAGSRDVAPAASTSAGRRSRVGCSSVIATLLWRFANCSAPYRTGGGEATAAQSTRAGGDHRRRPAVARSSLSGPQCPLADPASSTTIDQTGP